MSRSIRFSYLNTSLAPSGIKGLPRFTAVLTCLILVAVSDVVARTDCSLIADTFGLLKRV